eukprot:UN3786
MGVSVITFTVLCSVYPSAVTANQQRVTLLVGSLVTSVITSYTALVDPYRKWVQLRNGAYSLEAEIWKFRARVGEYQGTSSSPHSRMWDERNAEAILQQVILQVQGRVLLSTGLKETSFYSVEVHGAAQQKRPAELALGDRFVNGHRQRKASIDYCKPWAALVWRASPPGYTRMSPLCMTAGILS